VPRRGPATGGLSGLYGFQWVAHAGHSALSLALSLQSTKRMSVLRTMSLIAGGALVALGGSALALFI
jgi:hypothetical protein